MILTSVALALGLLAALPPPVPPDTDIAPKPSPPRTPPAPTDQDKEKEKEKEETPDPAYMTLLPDDGSPWGLKTEVAQKLAGVAEQYLEYAVKFTCEETVRKARYDEGEVKKETTRRYGYLLERGDGQSIREFRQKMKSDGTVTTAEVDDAEAFPPAYSWVFLFSKANQSYFAYRERGDRFEGYDWVRIFEFKGAIPYTDGRDIRQWDGVVLVDAATLTPVEVRAEPSRQQERLKVLFERWSQSFNVAGFRVGPKPVGFSGRVLFQTRRDRLTFPTQLRYNSFRAVTPKRTEPTDASTRDYAAYRFFETATKERPGERVEDK
ncbi:MAG TPA: hypothetical protein VFB67_02530 [Candidatus Polarisedimenticolaceae bacterium]|nr:hypothetical protein [Candidatus Polarisedimenticolaceae bacterium]